MTGAGTRYKYEAQEDRGDLSDRLGQIMFGISSRGNGDMADSFRHDPIRV